MLTHAHWRPAEQRLYAHNLRHDFAARARTQELRDVRQARQALDMFGPWQNFLLDTTTKEFRNVERAGVVVDDANRSHFTDAQIRDAALDMYRCTVCVFVEHDDNEDAFQTLPLEPRSDVLNLVVRRTNVLRTATDARALYVFVRTAECHAV